MDNKYNFFETIETAMEHEIKHQIKKESLKEKELREDEQKIKNLLDKVTQIEEGTSIRVPKLDKTDLKIDEDNLKTEMEHTMVLQSNILADIKDMKNALENMKSILNSIVGIIHHYLRFKNTLKLKPGKELETYIAKEPSYNTVNLKIKQLQNIIDMSSENSALLKQKIGFIRDLIKERTQEMFNAKCEG